MNAEATTSRWVNIFVGAGVLAAAYSAALLGLKYFLL
jgi:hypothetical protein